MRLQARVGRASRGCLRGESEGSWPLGPGRGPSGSGPVARMMSGSAWGAGQYRGRGPTGPYRGPRAAGRTAARPAGPTGEPGRTAARPTGPYRGPTDRADWGAGPYRCPTGSVVLVRAGCVKQGRQMPPSQARYPWGVVGGSKTLAGSADPAQNLLECQRRVQDHMSDKAF